MKGWVQKCREHDKVLSFILSPIIITVHTTKLPQIPDQEQICILQYTGQCVTLPERDFQYNMEKDGRWGKDKYMFTHLSTVKAIEGMCKYSPTKIRFVIQYFIWNI